MANLNINLLPGATAEDAKTKKLHSLFNRVLTIGLTVFVVVSLIFSSVLLFFSLQLRNLEREKDDAEVAVKNLQDTEQKVFFIQDRLTKVKAITAADALKTEVAGFNEILNTLPEGAILREANVNLNSISTIVEVKDPGSLTTFLSQIVTKDFARINLKEFNYSPAGGYVLTMIYTVK